MRADLKFGHYIWRGIFGGELFGADGEDLFGLDFDFDAEGRADVAALDNGAANPDVVGRNAGGAQGIVERAAAGIADERMIGTLEIVFVAKLAEVRNVFELAIAERSFAGEGPIAGGGSGGAAGKANDGGGNIFTGEFVADEEIGGGPGLGKIRDFGDRGLGFGGMREGGVGVWRRRGNFELRGLLNDRLLHGLGMGKPANGDEEYDTGHYKGQENRQQRDGGSATRTWATDARDLRHVGFQVSWGLVFSHSANGSLRTRVVLEGSRDRPGKHTAQGDCTDEEGSRATRRMKKWRVERKR